MSFKTASGLKTFSTGTFVDNSNGLITPTMFRNMHEHFADSLTPYDASGVYSVKIIDTGNVPTPTTSGAIVFDTGTPSLHLFNGASWVSISGGGGGGGGSSYLAGSGLELAGTTFNTVAATTAATGMVILTNTIDSSQNKALTPKAVFDSGYLTEHPTITNAASNSDNSGRTYVQDLLFDSNGHVTGVSTATETVTDTTYTAGTGLLLSGSAFSTAGTGTFEVITVADTGNFAKSLTVGSGVELLNATPPVTTNKIYNVGGELYFNGAAVSSGGAGGGSYNWVVADGSGNSETVASGNTVYVSGVNAVTTVYTAGTNILTIDATDTNTTYTAGTGLALNGTQFSTAQTGHFDSVVVTGSGNIGGILHTEKASKTPIKSNADGATITFDLNESNTHTATLGGNRTMALSNPSTGQRFMLRLQQDATGSRTVTWFTTIKWAGVTPPTLSTSGNRADMFGFVCTSGGQYDGFVVGQNL